MTCMQFPPPNFLCFTCFNLLPSTNTSLYYFVKYKLHFCHSIYTFQAFSPQKLILKKKTVKINFSIFTAPCLPFLNLQCFRRIGRSIQHPFKRLEGEQSFWDKTMSEADEYLQRQMLLYLAFDKKK